MLRIKARIRKWKAERKLEKSGYYTWARYRHNRDPDVARYADDVDSFYEGYPYVCSFKDYSHYAFKCVCDNGPFGDIYGYDEMRLWCEDKIRWDYRMDIHRVWEDDYGKAKFDDIGGRDIIYVAFKNKKDLTYFLLRWS